MNIYFAGIGGVGLGPLAEISLDLGHHVTGSDSADGLITQQLEDRQVAISHHQDGSFLRSQHQKSPIDWLVYTAGLPSDHPELVTAQELGIKISKRDELLVKILNENNLKLIAIAGTHGKTSTTALLIWLMNQLAIPASYSIGTTMNFGPSGQYTPDSQYLIYECDEFDRNFLQFKPDLSIITSIGYDHPDTYPTESSYRAAFRQFVTQSAQTVAWQDDINDIASPSTLQLTNNSVNSSLELAGQHNRQNASLVLEAVRLLWPHVDSQVVIDALNKFPGVGRRFEQLRPGIFTDYGHTPDEIAATLQMAREVAPSVVLVYQPHQNVRQHQVRSLYVDTVFQDAEMIYWLPTYLSREDTNLPVLTVEELTENLNNTQVRPANLNDQLWQNINQWRQQGYIVLCMGAGSIDGWLRQKVNAN